jgi:hypothetical protein
MTIEIPKSGGRIEAQLLPANKRCAPLSVKLGRSGHVVYKTASNAEDGIFGSWSVRPANWPSWSRTGSPSGAPRHS